MARDIFVRSTTLEQLYTAAASRELDRVAIEGLGVPGFELMRRAGQATFDTLLHRWPELRRVSVCCGKGNNAGDGYIVAGLAQQQGIGVELIQIGDPGELTGAAASARDWALGEGVQVQSTDDGRLVPGGDVIVDALLGTGIKGVPRSAYATLIETIESLAIPVLAVDIPSGVNADTGAVAGAAITAEATVTFIGRKLGLHTGAGAARTGTVIFADLGVGGEVHALVSGVDWLTWQDTLTTLPRRDASAYKQQLGHLLVVGGDHSMGGAVLMTAEAALRCGAGMVTVLTRGHHRSAILSRRPEVMVVDAEDETGAREALVRASTLTVGPGLGRGDWGARLLQAALDTGKPMLIDADGLNLMAEAGLTPPSGTVITPHAAEAATLLETETASVQADRLRSAMDLARQVQGVAVLKGAGTVIASSTTLLGVCAHGNPGMASAGMGDVLSGVIGGLLAQGLDPEQAATAGVCLHSLAADRAVGSVGQRSLLATDLMPVLVALLAETDP